MSATNVTNRKAATRQTWNYRGPVVFSPLFSWPPDPKGVMTAVGKRWVTLSRNTIFLLFAVITYPTLDSRKSLSRTPS